MKKFNLLFLLTAALLLLGSCGKKTVKEPDEILIDGKVIKYSYTLDQVEAELGDGIPGDFITSRSNTAYEYANDLTILYNDEDKIRLIHIADDDIMTYKGIRVGDNIEKVFDSFEYVMDAEIYYNVYFYGDSEFDANDKDKRLHSDWVTISYQTDEDGEIEIITIMDNEYAILFK